MNAKEMARMMGLAVILFIAGWAKADVLNMGGTRNADGTWTGLASLETVPVGNPGNPADTRYETPGFGAVNYTYNIGKYEVTAGQYCEFLNAVAKTDTYNLYSTQMPSLAGCKIQRSGSTGSYTYNVASDWANRPVNYVSWGDAARFANWLHNGQPSGAQDLITTEDGAYFLNGAMSADALLAVSREADWKWATTSEDEWHKAAYYNLTTGSYYDYPTSSNRSDTTLGRDMNDTLGYNANYHVTPSDTYPIDNGKYTTVVGEFQNSASPYSTFDQGGNICEWNEAILSGSYRGVRGGSFYTPDVCLLASYRDICYDPSFEFSSLGFRVSEVPEPGTMALLALGGIAMLRRRVTA